MRMTHMLRRASHQTLLLVLCGCSAADDSNPGSGEIDAEGEETGDTGSRGDGSGLDADGCASTCRLGSTISGEWCDLVLADMASMPLFASWEFRRIWGCPCAVAEYQEEHARCSFDQDYDLFCDEYVWSAEHNGDGPNPGGAPPCGDRIDWIVENTRWLSLDLVTDRDGLRELVEARQPCPDPYGGEL